VAPDLSGAERGDPLSRIAELPGELAVRRQPEPRPILVIDPASFTFDAFPAGGHNRHLSTAAM
jgi:hypothetical protein